MNRRPIINFVHYLGRPELRFKLWMGGLVVLSLPVLGYLLLWAVVSLMFWSLDEVDVPIPKDEARLVLMSLLKSEHGAVLVPEAEVVEAHRTSGGLQGDGTNWYLVRLPPGGAQRLEDELVAHIDAMRRVRWEAKFIDRSIVKTLGWRSGAPPDARGYQFSDSNSTYAVFFGDQFYYQFFHY